MDLLKSLIIGWSIVWSITLFSIARFEVNDSPILLLIRFGGIRVTAGLKLLVLMPLYAFVVWIIGCIFIVTLIHGYNRYFGYK